MVIAVSKFGKMLISRPAGKEAVSVMLSSFKPQLDTEVIDLDFTDVNVVTPAWLDEVLNGLKSVYGDRVRCRYSNNLSLKESLKFLQLG